MKKIAIFYEKDIYPKSSTALETVGYIDRVTGKAIIFDKEGMIALVGNNQNDFYLLPGGGVDREEEVIAGVSRECLEEVGCKVGSFKEVGCIEDYRPRDKKHYISYCYVVYVDGDKGTPYYTEKEISVGMHVKWVTISEALVILRQQKTDLEEGRVKFYNTGYNIVRDLLFLEEASRVYE